MASVSISCPSCSATDGVVRNGKSTAGHQRYLCSHCRKTWQLQFTYTASQPGTHQKIIDMAMNGVGYDRLRKTVVAHVFGERTMATLGRLMSLLSPFDVVIWMTDGWPLYESRLKGKLHVISKRYTQRIERHNLNLRQHLARLGRKSLSFSKSVELHDKVIGHYLNIKHYQ
ncbi:IS1 family transposase [Klebsiella pneumoniae]|uniref:IS1 family transposase n=1 Tax=Klebsiella pneumoniae TaxID=573 RepID=UPI0021A861BD|nr:IS1 family transposase [Klebsiella pneumoniae]MCT2447503.1 IS1 family transposase [Klebsiella pneumoniae]